MLLHDMHCIAHSALIQRDGKTSGIPSIKPSSAPKGTAPKASTPKAALTKRSSEAENDDGEEVISLLLDGPVLAVSLSH